MMERDTGQSGQKQDPESGETGKRRGQRRELEVFIQTPRSELETALPSLTCTGWIKWAVNSLPAQTLVSV